MEVINQIMAVCGQLLKFLVLLPGLDTGEVVVWLPAGYHTSCGQSSVVMYRSGPCPFIIQPLIISHYLMNE